MGKKVFRLRSRLAGFSTGLAGFVFVIMTISAQEPSNPTPGPLTTQTPALTSASFSTSPSVSVSDPPPLDVPENPAYAPDAEVPLPAPETSDASVEADANVTGISSSPRRFHYNLQIGARFAHDDNIFLRNTDRQSDYYLAISPQLTLGFGDYNTREENFVRVDYAPSMVFYRDHSEENGFQQIFRLTGQYRLRRLTLVLSQGIDVLDGVETDTKVSKDSLNNRLNLDVSGRTKRKIYVTDVSANYDFSAKTFLSVPFSLGISDYDDLISSRRFSTGIYINYRYSPKLIVGVGGTGGLEVVDDPNPDQTFEQANVQVTYEAGEKLSFSASAGLEFRQFEDDAANQHVSPVFNLGATYKPFDGTELRIDGSRQTLPSAVLAGQDFVTTSISAELRQRLLRRIFLGLSIGYQNSEYFATVEGVNATRQDNYFYVEPTIDVAITRYWLCGIFYLRRQNDSADGSFTFDDNQVGLRTLLKF